MGDIQFGLLGEKLGHSLSPQIHDFLLEKQGLIGNYKLYELEKEALHEVFQMMEKKGILGLNVTIPYKETLFNMVDQVDEHAQNIAAINTIKLENGITYGYNTDYLGAFSMLKKAQVDLKEKDVLLIGSGGAAKALIYALHLAKARNITVGGIDLSALQNLKKQFPYIETVTMAELKDSSKQGDIIINTSPVGMYPKIEDSPVDERVLKNYKTAVDIVYNPLYTRFLTMAKDCGLKTVTGLMMLVDQAVAAQEIWLNKPLDYAWGSQIHENLKERFL